MDIPIQRNEDVEQNCPQTLANHRRIDVDYVDASAYRTETVEHRQPDRSFRETLIQRYEEPSSEPPTYAEATGSLKRS